ncbi:MAG: DUF402 domain-containing protein [Ktedonobacterales bacterium]|nr:DUF402 domain-containing protein [Ktedonobacterales bacterium]
MANDGGSTGARVGAEQALSMLVRKCDASGNEQTRYAGTVLHQAGPLRVIGAQWDRARRDLGYTVFMPGDRFTEYFYGDQWFNIMRVGSGDENALKGWYCNITHPAIFTAADITYVDLLLDVWVQADGQTLVLDEDEFAAAVLDAPTQVGAHAGLAEVLRWVQHHLGPFAELANGGHAIFAADHRNEG